MEKKWSDIWLFFANTTRFASAMGGGGDYGVFADGRYHLNERILALKDWLDIKKSIAAPEKLEAKKNGGRGIRNARAETRDSPNGKNGNNRKNGKT